MVDIQLSYKKWFQSTGTTIFEKLYIRFSLESGCVSAAEGIVAASLVEVRLTIIRTLYSGYFWLKSMTLPPDQFASSRSKASISRSIRLDGDVNLATSE